MSDLIRFGRRVPLPSSVGILHELLIMQRDEEARRLNAAKLAPPANIPDIEARIPESHSKS